MRNLSDYFTNARSCLLLETVLCMVPSDCYTTPGIRYVTLAQCPAKQRGPELSGLPSARQEEASRGQPLLIPPHFLRVFRGRVKLQIFVVTLERKHG